MLLSIIVAMDERRGLGKDNRLPWHLPAEFRLFKERTMGHHLISGRKTFESLGKPLRGRTHIVISRKPTYTLPEGCFLVPSLEGAIEIAQSRGETEAFIIGGAYLYTRAFSVVDRIYLTTVHAVFDVDVFFPVIDERNWSILENADYPADEKNAYSFSTRLLVRKPGL
jgi:dihydrofolate reductase